MSSISGYTTLDNSAYGWYLHPHVINVSATGSGALFK